jgi:hypothetical protein
MQCETGEGKNFVALGAWNCSAGNLPRLGKHVRRLRTVCGGPFLPLVLQQDSHTKQLRLHESIAAALDKCVAGDPLAASVTASISSTFGTLPMACCKEEFVLVPAVASVLQPALQLLEKSLLSKELRGSAIFCSASDDSSEPDASVFLRSLAVTVLFSRALGPVVTGHGLLAHVAADDVCCATAHNSLQQVRLYFEFVTSLLSVDMSDPVAHEPIDDAVRELLQLSTSKSPESADNDAVALRAAPPSPTPDERIEGIVDSITAAFTQYVLERCLADRSGATSTPLQGESSEARSPSMSENKQATDNDDELGTAAPTDLVRDRYMTNTLRRLSGAAAVIDSEDASDGFQHLVWDVVTGAALLARDVLVSDCTDPPRGDGVRFGTLCRVATTSTDLFFVERERPSEGPRKDSSGGNGSAGRPPQARTSPGSVVDASSAPSFAWDLPPAARRTASTSGVISVSFTSVWSLSEFTLQMPLQITASSQAAPVMHGIVIATRNARRWYLCFGSQTQKEMVLAKVSSVVTAAGGSLVSMLESAVPSVFSSNFAPAASGATFAVISDAEAGSSMSEQAVKRSPGALLAACATASGAVGQASGSAGLWQLYLAKKVQHLTSLSSSDSTNSDDDAVWATSWTAYDPRREFSRQKLPQQFMLDETFNASFAVVPTYPAAIVVPSQSNTEVLKAAALRRVNGRLEALTYYFHRTGGCIVRCSQPTTVRDTLSRWTSTLAAGAGVSGPPAPDGLLQLYRDAIASRAVETIDLRDRLAAFANVFKGGGYSAASEFCAMHNIHAVRKSFAQLCDLLQRNAAELATKAPPLGASLDPETVPGESQVFGPAATVADANKAIMRTNWLEMIVVLLQTALAVARKVAGVSDLTGASVALPGGRMLLGGVAAGVARSFEESSALLRSGGGHADVDGGVEQPPAGIDLCSPRQARVVVVHCSDGWDRTSQVCAVSQVLLDPYFRTIEGFCVLIEKEFVSFGHPFALRNEHCGGSSTQAAPVFFQFLDAVRHLVRLFPANFQFTESFLLFVADCHISGLAGDLVSNCNKDRQNAALHKTTLSLWQLVQLVLCGPEDERRGLASEGSGLSISPVRAAESQLVNLAYSHSWNLVSGGGGGALVGTDFFPLAGNLWEAFFFRYSPFRTAAVDQISRRGSYTLKDTLSSGHPKQAAPNPSACVQPRSASCRSLADVDAPAPSSLPASQTNRFGTGAHTPTSPHVPLLVPRNASFSSVPLTPGASPSRATRRQMSSSGRGWSDVELPRLEPSALLVPRNSSAASLATSPAVTQRPPRPPSSILNQFLLADDDE